MFKYIFIDTIVCHTVWFFVLVVLRNKARRNGQVDDDENLDDNELDYIDENPSDSSDEEKNLMQYFKNCVVAQEIEMLREKMKTSIDFRRSDLISPPGPIYKIFPFYFVDVQLVKPFITRNVILYLMNNFLLLNLRFSLTLNCCSIISMRVLCLTCGPKLEIKLMMNSTFKLTKMQGLLT